VSAQPDKQTISAALTVTECPAHNNSQELGVLEVLMRAEGAVVSAEELLEKAWDENADPFTNAVRVAVMTLRRKLGQPPVIETVPGAGYRLGC
jgi:DNA-binding response OmpR family regulator